MFGPGVSAMPSEMRPKANKLEISGMVVTLSGRSVSAWVWNLSIGAAPAPEKIQIPSDRCDTALPSGGHNMRWQALQASLSAPPAKPTQANLRLVLERSFISLALSCHKLRVRHDSRETRVGPTASHDASRDAHQEPMNAAYLAHPRGSARQRHNWARATSVH